MKSVAAQNRQIIKSDKLGKLPTAAERAAIGAAAGCAATAIGAAKECTALVCRPDESFALVSAEGSIRAPDL